MSKQEVVPTARFKEMSPGLIRQRRNLIGASIALLILEFGDVTVERLNILGNELKINNVGSIQTIAFFICFYFLVRFYQYTQANHGTGIQYEYASYLRGIIREFLSTRGYEEFSVAKTKYRSLRVSIELTTIKDGLPEPNTYEFGYIATLQFSVKSLSHLIFTTPLATDYILPYVLSFLALSAHLLSYIARWY